MGCTVRAKDGAWWVFVHHDGRRTSRRIGPGDQGRKAAKAAAAKIAARLALGDATVLDASDTPKVPTFKQVANEWERVAGLSWKRGTQITYGNGITFRILPTFGALPITDITPERVEAWWTSLREEGLSPERLCALRVILRGICQRAVRQGLLPTNPVEAIAGGLGKRDRETRKVDYLVAEDLAKLLEVAERVTPTEHPTFAVMGTGGLRLGEAVALQVGDLDAPGKRVHIRRMVRRGYISSPKNGKGRVVDLPASTVALLEQVRQIRQAEAAVKGTEARWLFPGQGGLCIAQDTVQKAFKRALRAAGIRKVRPHDLRHTYATLAIQAGVPLLAVSRQLGHASIAITADVYCHALPGGNRAAAEALEEALTRAQTHPPRTLPV